MKVSKTIWVPDKEIEQIVICRQPEVFFLRLLFAFFISFTVSGCNFWPKFSEREISVSHRIPMLAPGINEVYLAHLLEISKKRYIELKNSGAIYCLPGQMLKIRKKQELVEHEIDGGLIFDAHINMRDLFNHLYNLRNQVENNNPSKACYEFYADSNKGSVQTLGVWDNLAEISTLMEAE